MQVMYARMEEADALIESLMQDKDPNLRQSGMYTVAMAYCGTGNNKAIKRLLHVAVRTRGCRFFMWRCHTTALLKKILLHNSAARPCHAFMHICLAYCHATVLSRNIGTHQFLVTQICHVTLFRSFLVVWLLLLLNDVTRECDTLRCCVLELQGNAFGHLLVIVHWAADLSLSLSRHHRLGLP